MADGFPLRVVIDARPLLQNAGGFRSYVRALLLGLCQLPGQGDGIFLYVDRPVPPEIAAHLPPRAQVRVLSASRLRADFRDFAAQVRRDKPDVVHGTANYLPLGLPTFVCQTVTIHDAFGIKPYPWDEPLHRWTLRDRMVNRYWAYATRATARRARKIITVSRGSQTELMSALPDVPPARYSVIYNGITLAVPEAKAERDTGRVLVMAAPDSRKNLSVVARAFGNASKAAWGKVPVPCLEVVCGSDKTARRAEALLRENGAVFRLRPCPDDADLAAAFSGAGAFIWPSRGEGFGLPPLEAMLCGCPVVSSNAPAMPEILGDAPAYFAPDNADELVFQISRLLTNPDEAQARSKRGKAHAAAFTPERMARQHYDVWLEAAR